MANPETTNPCPECGGPTHLVVGTFTTCGGLARPSAEHWEPCGRYWLHHPQVIQQVREAEPGAVALTQQSPEAPTSALERAVPPGPWCLTQSGLSFQAGPIRVRLEGGSWADRIALATYLVKQAPRIDAASATRAAREVPGIDARALDAISAVLDSVSHHDGGTIGEIAALVRATGRPA